MVSSAFSRRSIAALAVLGLGACANHGAPSSQAALSPAAAGPAAAAKPARPPIGAADLVALHSLTAAGLTARLGQPDFKREEESAQIWQYRGPSCVLDVFLYPEGGEFKVAHAVTRNRSDDAGPATNCVPFATASG